MGKNRALWGGGILVIKEFYTFPLLFFSSV